MLQNQLIVDIIEATGLPQHLLYEELITLITSMGYNPSSLTLSELRDILSCYLQETLLIAKENPEKLILLSQQES